MAVKQSDLESETSQKSEKSLEVNPKARPQEDNESSDIFTVGSKHLGSDEMQADLHNLKVRNAAYKKALLNLMDSIDQRKRETNALKNETSEAISSLAKSVAAVTKELDDHRKETIEEFSIGLDAALAAFREQQAIRQPVDLWKEKQIEHNAARDLSYRGFIVGLGAAAIFIVALIWGLSTQSDYLAGLLAPAGCDPTAPSSNCSGFSLKGMLLVAGVLTLFTLLLWFIRLQMKLYLAERHLALDARERLAFAQSYLGLVREGDTSEEAIGQRALVYAALFRPASDGTVREEGGLDPSVAAALSKFLLKS
jgi:peroxiredoxin